ncbi:MAG TPA: Type 1 glutamine amidotransferase-like domain-containing protein [Candidatus Saccharimonadales bacterium]|nr:Type 1 glutamine amidotransferase-like domain-containing protein [Candidatus Saccharimonadales bacterium]
MKLYLSSIGIPAPEELVTLLGKPLDTTTVALIPNAKDYYSKRAWEFTINSRIEYMKSLGLNIEVVDLKNYMEESALKNKLSNYDFIWAMGGNTFMLRYEMKRSGFDKIIQDLLNQGIIYGGDSAGALVAGLSINGIESADEPGFSEEVINSGIGIVPFSILPHLDNPEFSEVVPLFKKLHQQEEIIELKDSQAVIFENGTHRIVNGQVPAQF